MLKLRYYIRLIQAFTSKFKAIILFGILIGVIGFFFFRAFAPYFIPGKSERIGIVGRFSPDSLPNYILEMVGDGLTFVNEKGEVVPNLAESWETVDKGRTWKFILKEGLVWQDGKPVVSKTIGYSFSDVTVERPDAKTLIFKLKNPFSPFPSVVSKPTFEKGLLGTGGWKVTKLSLVGSFVQKLVISDKNRNIKSYSFFPTEEAAKLAFKLGQVDRLDSIFSPEPLSSWKNVKTAKASNLDQYAAVFFNTKDPVLSDKVIRQALSYAVNKEALAGARAISPISPNSWAYNPQVKPYNYDKERARDLISSLSKEQKDNLAVKLTVTPVLLSSAEKIKKDWEEIGVKTAVQVSSAVPSEYQALLAIFDIPKDPDQYSVWHSTQTGSNLSRYEDPRIDKLLENGRSEVNVDERRKIYLDFQRFLLEDAPAAFLYHPISYSISRN